MAAVSTIVNRGTPLKAYVFRNYNLLPGVRSHYLGGCQHQLWQAIRATSAAPGYFQEFTLGNDLHQVSPFYSCNTHQTWHTEWLNQQYIPEVFPAGGKVTGISGI